MKLIFTKMLSLKKYIESNLETWLLNDGYYQEAFNVVSTSVKTSDHLDGFMSTIFLCDVVLQAKENSL